MAFGGFLKQSTAVDILVGPMLDSTDGDTEETGLTISQADIKLSKNGQALAQKNDVTAASHDANGYYNCELDATDTNTCGQLTVIIHESGALACRHEYQVVEEDIYAALFAASAAAFDSNQRVDVGSVSGTAQTANDNGADINEILVDTAEIGAAGVGLTAVPWNASWDAEVQSEVQDAIEVNNLDHLAKVADADDVVDNSIIAKMAASDGDWSGYDNTSDSQEALRDRGDAAWTTGAGTGLSSLATGTAQAGAAGTITLAAGATATDNLYNGCRIATTGGTGAGQSRIITDYDGTTKVATIKPNWVTNPGADTTYEIQAADSSLGTIENDGQSATDLKDFSDAGYDSSANKVQGVVLVDTTTTNTDMVSEPPTAAAIRSEIDSNSTQLTAIVGDTNELQTDLTDGGRLDALIDAIKVVTDNLPDSGALNDLATLAARLTAARAGYLDELGAANIPGDIDTLLTRVTASVALASVLGALDDAAADGDPTNADTVVQYLKQIINILVGTAGIVAFPEAADPANGVSLAEVIRRISSYVSTLGVVKNQAWSNFTFQMVDETDGLTPETGKTVTAQRSLDAGALASASGSVTEMSNGLYQFDALAADTNGDLVTWRFSATGCLDAVVTFKTIS
jgi:hypothetical protein